MKNQLSHQNVPVKTVTLNEAAAEFNCAASSLKNNVKSGNLPATQEGPKTAFMVRLQDVEGFLRATPGIASRFHPKPAETPAENATEATPKGEDHGESAATPVPPPPAEEASDAPDPVSATSGPEGREFSATTVSAEGFGQTVRGGKRSRHRSRRRGRGTTRRVGSNEESQILKIVSGTPSGERLRIIACLNKLAAIIASV